LERRWVIQQADHCAWLMASSQPGQGAFAGLPGTVDEDDTGVCQRLGHEGLGMPWHQARKFDHGSIVPYRKIDGQIDAQCVVT
jgi:hypothetical protein